MWEDTFYMECCNREGRGLQVQDCMRLALQFWSCVREIEMTMSGHNEKKTDTNEGSEGQEPKKKKKNKGK